MPSRLAQLAAEVWDLWKRQRYAEALPLAEQYCDVTRVLPGATGRRHYVYGINMLAALLYRTGDLLRAETLLREALDICRTTDDLDHALCAEVLENLGRICTDTGNLEEAAAVVRDAFTLLTDQYGEQHAAAVQCRRHLDAIELQLAETRPSADIEPEAAPASPATPDIYTRRGAWYASGDNDGDYGFLFITRDALLWRAAQTDHTCTFSLHRITALGHPDGATLFYLILDSETQRHTFDVGEDAETWVLEIYAAIHGDCHDPLAGEIDAVFDTV